MITAVGLTAYVRASEMNQRSWVYVCDDRGCLSVELAQDEATRRRGLQMRSSLRRDEGMLFVFDHPGRHAFWMKDTWIPLDMVWLDQDGTIVDLVESVAPCEQDPCPVFRPQQEAWMVLEVASGVAAQRGWAVGTRLNITSETALCQGRTFQRTRETTRHRGTKANKVCGRTLFFLN